MLQVTDAAAAIFKDVVRQQDPDAAIRLALVADEAGQQGIAVQVVHGPIEGDQTGEASDLDVFVAPELVEPLDAAVLDAVEGQDGFELVLRPQAEGAGA